MTVTGVPIHGHRPVRPVLVITVFCLGLFMTLLDITIVNIAIPDLVTDLNATLETVLWVGSAYSLTYTVLLITAGRLGDIYGPRRLFLLGLTVFTVASLASGLSQTPGQLIAFRALQGVGAALLAPQGLPIITSILPAAKRGPAFAATGIMSGLGVLLGPTLGGFIVTNVGWRWIFFLNIPIGVIAIALAFVFMPDVRPGVRHRLDIPGVALLTAGLLGVVFGLIEGERYDWGTIAGFVTIPLVIAVGVVLLGLFLWRQFRTQDAEPLLPFAVFSDRTFTVMTLVLLAMGFAMVGVFLPMTIYYQSVLGLTAVAAGLVIGTQSLAMMITSGVVGGLSGSGRINMKWVLIGGLLLFAAGMVYVVLVAEPDSGQWAFVPGLVAAGIGLGCVWTPGVRAGHPRHAAVQGRGRGRACWTPCRSSASVLATAVLGALLANRLTAAMRMPHRRRRPTGAARSRPGAVRRRDDRGRLRRDRGRRRSGVRNGPAGRRAGVGRRADPRRGAARVRGRVHRRDAPDDGGADRGDRRGRGAVRRRRAIGLGQGILTPDAAGARPASAAARVSRCGGSGCGWTAASAGPRQARTRSPRSRRRCAPPNRAGQARCRG